MRKAVLCLCITHYAHAAQKAHLAARVLCCAIGCAPVHCHAAPLPIVDEAVDALRSRGSALTTQQQVAAAPPPQQPPHMHPPHMYLSLIHI